MSDPTLLPARGDVWMVNLGVPIGHEVGGQHPALVLSANSLNRGPAGLAIVLPMTSKFKGIPSHVPIEPPEGGVRQTSYIKCEDIRSISTVRLSVRWGAVSGETMERVAYRVKLLLDF